MEKYLRVFKFMLQVLGMARKHTVLLRPMLYNILVAVPVSLAIGAGCMAVDSSGAQYAILAVGVVALYFIDYYHNGLTVALVYDAMTGSTPAMASARARARKVAGGILIFAGVSGLLDLLSSYAQERNDVVGKILTGVVHWLWTTATYIVMPAMIIEGLTFGAAFGRARQTMKQDPTQVGTGVIGIALANWALGLVCGGIAYFGLRGLANVHPLLGIVFFLVFFNAYWAISGFIKITYFTCFYMWAVECEKKQSADVSLAPEPLAKALG